MNRRCMSLAERLFEEPFRFDFSRAVRLLERIGDVSGSMGRDTPRREAVRFAVHQSLAFPASAIHDLRRGEDRGASSSGPALPAVMTVAFFGLTGPKGILPVGYTTELRERLRSGDRMSAEFFDIFNHRLIALFFRAGEKYRIAKDEGKGPHHGTFADALRSLIGLGATGAATGKRLGIDDRRLLRLAGLFSRQVRSAEGLASLIVEALGFEAEILQFIPRWVDIGPEFRSRIGPGGRNHALGQGCVIGRRYLDVRGKFRIRIGPLTLPQFRGLLPGAPALRELVELARLYVGPEYVFDVELILRADQVPRAQLGGGADPPALNRHAWAAAGPIREDPAVFVDCGTWHGEEIQPTS